MKRHRTPRHGDGTAWLVVDRLKGDYLCSWYTGTDGGHLVEDARLSNASEAVAWGRLRTSRVRIRTADACTYWAGTAPRPEGFSHTWADPDTTDLAHLPLPDDTEHPSGPGRRTGQPT